MKKQKAFLLTAGLLASCAAITSCGTSISAGSTANGPIQVQIAPQGVFPGALRPSNPPELGAVSWIRGFETATARAKELRKPLLTLFQEVPG